MVSDDELAEAQFRTTQPDYRRPDVVQEQALLYREEGFKALAPDLTSETGRRQILQTGRIAKGSKVTAAEVVQDALYLDWLSEDTPGKWNPVQPGKATPIEIYMVATGSEGGKARAEYVDIMRVSRPQERRTGFGRFFR